MIRLCVTGAEGFLGSALRAACRTDGGFEFQAVPREAFRDAGLLAECLSSCDALVHFAGLSRHPDGEYLLRTNLALTETLISALERARVTPRLFFASTTHAAKQTPYHESKRRSRALFEAWADRNGADCMTLLMPNAFGPGGKPFFNSVVPTFCLLAARGETPPLIENAVLKLISSRGLSRRILSLAARTDSFPHGPSAEFAIPHEYEIALPELWRKLTLWRPFLNSESALPPGIETRFDADLWETFLDFRS